MHAASRCFQFVSRGLTLGTVGVGGANIARDGDKRTTIPKLQLFVYNSTHASHLVVP